MSTSSIPSPFAVSAISKFFPTNDLRSPWSCLSPRAATTAIVERSELPSSSATDARYAMPPADISLPPSIPYFHAFITPSSPFSSSGIWWWSSIAHLPAPSDLFSLDANPPPRSVIMQRS